MKRPALMLAILCQFFTAHATISVIREYHLGEDDPDVTVGMASTISVDSIASNNLTMTGGPVYSADAAPGSSISLSFNGTNYGTASLMSLTNNFGVEAWANTTVNSGSHFVIYNGTTSSSGWGILQNGSGNVWSGLLGGVVVVGAAPVTTNQWTDLALVCDNGVTTFYVNGIAVDTNNATPNAPAGSFVLGAVPENPTTGDWNGLLDEARVFTFNPGSFTNTDLLYYATNTAETNLALILNMAPTHNGVVLSWPTNRVVVLEANTNLDTTNWTTLSNAVAVGQNFEVTNAIAGPANFFRLLRVPCVTSDTNIPWVLVDGGQQYAQEMVLASTADSGSDPPGNPVEGGVALESPLDGSQTNTFDATPALTNLLCDPADPPPSVNWEIILPPALQSVVYTSTNIIGANTPVLTLPPSALPALQGTDAGSDIYWRMQLLLTYQQAGQTYQIAGYFRFEYENTTAVLPPQYQFSRK